MRATETLAGPSYPLARYINMARLMGDRLKFMQDVATYPGEIVRVPVSRTTLYLLREPEHVREVLVNQSRRTIKARGLQRSKFVLGEGLLTSEGDLHLRQRRLSQPAFHRQRLLSYGAAMIELAARHRERLGQGTGAEGARADRGAAAGPAGPVEPVPIELHQELMRLTLCIVGKTLFDTDIERDAGDIGGLLAAFFAAFPLVLLPGSEYIEKLPVPRLQRLRETTARLDALIYGMIAARRQEGPEERDHGDLLSMLIAAQDTEADGGTMSDRQLRDECVTLMLAGHETTANALTWTYFLLSQHPAVEARLHRELDQVLGGRLPEVADAPKLVYCEQVLAESIRLYPPAWMMTREVIEPLQLGTYTLLPGEIVAVSPWILHHDARFFPEPERFDPDRFLPAAKASRPRYSYIPFSSGPRNCIGEHFAWLEGVLLLATLSQRWRFELAPGQRVEPHAEITLRPRYGMRMLAHPRG